MADIFDKEKRSAIMRQVKSKKNKSTELRLIKIFKENGVTGWKRCFWHGHDCRNTRPSANEEFWRKKRERNIKHDKEITELFESRGWTVIRIWECELKQQNCERTLLKIKKYLSL